MAEVAVTTAKAREKVGLILNIPRGIPSQNMVSIWFATKHEITKEYPFSAFLAQVNDVNQDTEILTAKKQEYSSVSHARASHPTGRWGWFR